MYNLSPHINVMMNAARKAARGLTRDFGEVENLQVSRKGAADFVTNADLKSEKILIEALSRARPDYGILSEEAGEAKELKGEGHRWIIDPLDGTSNFMHGFPHFAISIGLEKIEGSKSEIVAGMVYAPVQNEIFWAEKNCGAFLNDKRIRVSSRAEIGDAFVGSGSFGFKKRNTPSGQNMLKIVEKVSARVASVRAMGSAALDLSYVAAGRYDGHIDVAIKSWDIAAGILLVKEAGGRVTDLQGKELLLDKGEVVASNYHLHDSLIGLLSA